MNKRGKIILIITIVLAVIISHTAALLGAGSYICDFALSRDLKTIGKAIEKGSSQSLRLFKTEYEWLNNNKNPTESQILSLDGLNLKAIEVNNADSSKWVILMHGYRGRATDMSYYSKYFYDHGFNCLIPWQRAHGNSEGEYITMGYKEKDDLIGWINYILSKDENAQIVLMGVSMGASTVMLATGENLPLNVKAAISDCGYSSVEEQFEHIMTDYMYIRKFPLYEVAEIFSESRAGFNFEDASMTRALSKSTTPTLFIHGKADNFVPFSMLEKVYNSAVLLEDGKTKEKLEVDGADHIMSASVDSQKYFEAVTEFLNNHIA